MDGAHPRSRSSFPRRVVPGRVRALALQLAWRWLGEDLGICAPVLPHSWVRKGYDREDAAREAIRLVSDCTQLSYERLVTLYEHVAYVERRGLRGCLVECGVWRGGASGVMAFANLSLGAERRMLHLFDSFQGMPERRADRDGQTALSLVRNKGTGALVRTGVNVADAESVRSLILDRIGYPAAFVHIHPGWFQDTLPDARQRIGPIAILRLDADWYESTKLPLENPYDMVVHGGVISIDDYGHFEGCRRATDEFLAAHAPTTYLHHVDYTGRYFIKP